MVINKILKYFLYFLGFLFLLAIAGASYFLYISNKKIKQKEIDKKVLQATCDTIQYVNTQPQITLFEFKREEIDTLYFEVIRNGNSIKDTIVTNIDYFEDSTNNIGANVDVPFSNFKKTDTILLKTKDKLAFYISEFSYEPYMFHGMFGYLGNGECRLKEDYTINGKKETYAALKINAIRIEK